MTNEIKLQTADTETFREKFLTTAGRINRTTFLKRSIALVAINFAVLFLTAFILMLGTSSTELPQWANLILFGITALFLIPDYCLKVKRLHDFGKDSTLAKIFLGISILTMTYGTNLNAAVSLSIFETATLSLPFVFLLYLLLKQGDDGANEYGN